MEEDLTVFTLFAMLNAAGYDDENASTGMHPVRIAVRRQLEHLVPPALRARLRTFYAAHRADASTWHYSVVAMATSGRPRFRPTSEWAEISGNAAFGRLAELHALLRAFDAAVDIPRLYAQVRPAYRTYIADYEIAVRRETGAVLSYLRVDSRTSLTSGHGEHNGARVLPNLLQSYEAAFSFNLGGRFISVEGPQPRIGYNPHEFIHAVTNPLSYDPRHAAAQAPAELLAAEARAALGAGNANRSAAAFMDECLVRAIALRYRSGGDEARRTRREAEMMNEYRQGYILERFFWEQLALFEAGHETLAEAYPAMLARLDAPAELARWRAARD